MGLTDFRGQRFGRLTVTRRNGSKGSYAAWECRCDCGSTVTVSSASLRTGNTKSCGCLRRDVVSAQRLKHGSPPEYSSWLNIKDRCYRPSNKSYAMYGGRGITMCDRWANDFRAFLADMGPRPSPQHSVERIDNDKGYAPENCRWATKAEQAFNRSTTVIVEHNGEQMALTAYAREVGVCEKKLWWRVRERGESLEEAVAHIRAGKGRKLTEDQVRTIKHSKASQTELARRFGVTQSLIWNILNGKSWRRIS